MKKNSTDSADIEQIKMIARWIAFARACAKTVFSDKRHARLGINIDQLRYQVHD